MGVGFCNACWFQNMLRQEVLVGDVNEVTMTRIGSLNSITPVDGLSIKIISKHYVRYIQHCMDLQLAVDSYKRRVLFENMV